MSAKTSKRFLALLLTVVLEIVVLTMVVVALAAGPIGFLWLGGPFGVFLITIGAMLLINGIVTLYYLGYIGKG